MDKIILITFFFLFSCGNKKNNPINIQSYKYKTEVNKNTYFADFNFSGDFEIFFNGILLTKNNQEDVVNGIEYLNPYISRSGQQNLTLIVKPLNKGNKISIQEAKDYFIDIIYADNGEPSPIHNVMRCSFPPISQPVDSLVYTWNFDADVPFEINILSNAKDLTQENPEKLLQEVIKKYQEVHKLINSGNVEEYMTIYKKSREREMISMYYDDIKQKEYLAGLENRVLLSKGFMQPLNDFQLLIHPNKKIVSLVNSQGKTPLYSIDDNKRIKTYGLQLYRSIKTGKLEVY